MSSFRVELQETSLGAETYRSHAPHLPMAAVGFICCQGCELFGPWCTKVCQRDTKQLDCVPCSNWTADEAYSFPKLDIYCTDMAISNTEVSASGAAGPAALHPPPERGWVRRPCCEAARLQAAGGQSVFNNPAARRPLLPGFNPPL